MNGTPARDDLVWYVAYASNLSAGRLRCYLQGGRPPGARRTYEGGRDPSPPTRDVALALPGRLVFAGRSRVWGGAMAFYDASAEGKILARGYLITFGQLSDLVSQEARQPVGHDLAPIQHAGRSWPTPSSVYEALVHLGHRDSQPMFCLTSQRPLEPAPPSAAYLRVILVGLREAFGWTTPESADYLLEARGVSPRWSRARISALTP
ncbi:histone deacetylase [Nocardioides gansuensis]|uniref:histone deacetylase n=1 Tax=Nocardioides gansuensis TaxID=2138300 RepID=UPI001BAB141A|nr:histone deacetylase [Nocardioides gansuensis]